MNPIIARSRRRGRARGASLFIIVALIAALGALGAFAMSAATSATAASGAARQASQAQHLTAYALQATLAELGTSRGPAYVQEAVVDPAPACASGAPCFVFSREQLELLGGPLLEPPGAARPGSLGRAELGWSCRVTMSDPMPALPPPPGFDETSAGAAAVRPVMVTLGATGALWPGAAPDGEAIAAAGARAEVRAHAVIRGVPR